MKVKIETATVWEKKRYEAGSVIEVSEETQELNKGWMKKVSDDTPLTEAPAPPDPKPTLADKTETALKGN